MRLSAQDLANVDCCRLRRFLWLFRALLLVLFLLLMTIFLLLLQLGVGARLRWRHRVSTARARAAPTIDRWRVGRHFQSRDRRARVRACVTASIGSPATR